MGHGFVVDKDNWSHCRGGGEGSEEGEGGREGERDGEREGERMRQMKENMKERGRERVEKKGGEGGRDVVGKMETEKREVRE